MIIVDHILDVAGYLDGIDVVIFDLDDTLYSEKEYVQSGYEAIGREFSLIPDMKQRLWEAFCKKQKAIDTVLKDFDCYSIENLQKCITIYREHEPSIHMYDGVYEMLYRLRAAGKKLGIITDGRPDGQRAKIRALNIEAIFDHIIITDEFGGEQFRKPNKRAFIEMKNFFDVDFNRIVYIGDNTKKDFIAPEMLGMCSIWFNNKDGLYC